MDADQIKQILETQANHEKRLLTLEGKRSHATEMKKQGKKALPDDHS